MTFGSYFRASSYATVAAATLALVLAGGLHLALGIAFAILIAVAWKIEGTTWQLSERTGLIVVLLSIPLFFLDWQYQKAIGSPAAQVGVSALAHLIVFLASVKLLQVKRDRDWVFLYLISFFEVLLAAGLSFSPVFLGSLTIYLLCSLSTIIAFEIQKSKRAVPASDTHLLVPPDSLIFRNARRRVGRNADASRLPWVAGLLLILIFVLALPLFLIAPRSGAGALTRGSGGLGSLIGFSENVNLGEIGNLKRNDALVMRIRVEGRPLAELRWRGVALDEYTGRGWKKSAEARRSDPKNADKGFFQLGTTEALNRLTTQTVFLEPIESPVLFAASRPVAIQGDFPSLRVDAEGSIQIRRLGSERVIYTAYSDMTEPSASVLRTDSRRYTQAFERYLRLPSTLDPRIAARANALVVNAHARNRYDEAKAIETQLQSDFGYSMQMLASGPDPLADFLFNVKAGHCEYFSTAMAVMLRTRGIASRVVNGFLPGEYNAAAGAYTVRQSDAHSWVEVYFPETKSWVTFDPTPMAGRVVPVRTGFAAEFSKYAEALELFWFQYVIGYDKQEQRTLATAIQTRLFAYASYLSQLLISVRRIVAANAWLVAFVTLGLLAALLFYQLAKRVRNFGWRRGLSMRSESAPTVSPVVFYERLLSALSKRGMERDAHLTPLEFAGSINLQPALQITRAYNRVRFGGEPLSQKEISEIERTLRELESTNQA